MSTTMDLTLSELRFFLNHISLPAETRLRVIFDDDNKVTKDYLENDAKKGQRKGFEKVLKAVPDAELDEYDKL